MVDWKGYEDLVTQRLDEARIRSAQPRYRPPPRRARGLLAWLGRLLPRQSRPDETTEPQSGRPAYR